MAYQIVRDRRELKRANELLIELLKQNVAKVWHRHPITFRPGKIEAEVCWNRQQQIWFAARRQVDHYWIAFGVAEPNGKDALNISVEINTPRKDIKRGRAGLILSDDGGQLYLAHTGRIGGGRPNINRKEFLAFHGLKSRDVIEYDRGKLAILIGAMQSPRVLVKRIGAFVSEVAKFKKNERRPQAINLPQQKDRPFLPKFIGTVNYTTRTHVQAELLHDLVVSVLSQKLNGRICRETSRRDLFILDRAGRVSVLYEVKTDCKTTSLYPTFPR